MTHAEASRFLHRIYRQLSLNDPPIIFKKMKTFAGMYEVTHIAIDPTSEILPVVVHEFIHFFYPDMEHPDVDKMEAEIVSKLTEKQWRNLYIRIAFSLRRCEKCGSQLPMPNL